MGRGNSGVTEKEGAADIARRVHAFRRQAGLTQEELARAADVTAKFVSQIENGHVNVSVGVLQRVVEDGLGIPLAMFFGADPSDDVMADARTLLALVATQPANVRRCAIRLVRALVEDEAPVAPSPRKPDGRR